jgi:hypothetical protein
MPVGYRSVMNVDGGVWDLARSEFNAWLRSKGVSDPPVEPGMHVVGAGRVLSVVELTRENQPRIARYRLEEDNTDGRWVTTLTVSEPVDCREAGWMWVEVDAPPAPPRGEGEAGPRHPRPKFTAPPRLVRNILGAVDATSGLAHLQDRPRVVFEEEVDDLIDVLCDPDRSILVQVAGYVPEMDQWVDRVEGWTRHTVGMAATYVLTQGAAAALQKAVGSPHAVPEGAIRSYLPEVDPASLLDARRHRLLAARTLVTSPDWRIRALLASATRRHTLGLPLPARLSRLDRQLARAESSLLFDWADRTAKASLGASPVALRQPPAPKLTIPDEAVDEALAGIIEATVRAGATVDEPAPPAPPAPPVGPPDGLLAALGDLVEEFSGDQDGPVDVTDAEEVLAALRGILVVGRSAQLSQKVLHDRLTRLEDQHAELVEESRELETHLQDAQLESAEALDQARWLEAENDRLRVELTKAGLGEVAWAETAVPEQAPADFEELIAWLGEGRLPNVVFTGDPDEAVALVEHDPVGAWASRAWDGLRALDGYARASLEGAYKGNFHGYCRSTPPGFPGWSANNHAAVESKSVENNPKMRKQRELPVPEEVDPAGRVFMGAHLKVTAARSLSPRIHYHDDVAGTGKVYVGYIGRHLVNTLTC